MSEPRDKTLCSRCGKTMLSERGSEGDLLLVPVPWPDGHTREPGDPVELIHLDCADADGLLGS